MEEKKKVYAWFMKNYKTVGKEPFNEYKEILMSYYSNPALDNYWIGFSSIKQMSFLNFACKVYYQVAKKVNSVNILAAEKNISRFLTENTKYIEYFNILVFLN